MFHARSRIVMEEVWKRGDELVRIIFADAYTTVRQIRNCLLGGFSQKVQRWFLPEDTASLLAAIAPAAFRGGTLLGRVQGFRSLEAVVRASSWATSCTSTVVHPTSDSSPAECRTPVMKETLTELLAEADLLGSKDASSGVRRPGFFAKEITEDCFRTPGWSDKQKSLDADSYSGYGPGGLAGLISIFGLTQISPREARALMRVLLAAMRSAFTERGWTERAAELELHCVQFTPCPFTRKNRDSARPRRHSSPLAPGN